MSRDMCPLSPELTHCRGRDCDVSRQMWQDIEDRCLKTSETLRSWEDRNLSRNDHV